MNESKFGQMLADAVARLLPQHKEVKLNSIWKNNGVKMEGICILDQDTYIAPTVYIDTFYENYQKGVDLNRLAEDFLHLYDSHRVDEKFDTSFFLDFVKAKERIVYKLINRNLNRQLLAAIPHREFMDLEIVFYYLMDYKSPENATILVHRPHLNMWKVTEEELWEHAKKNTPKLLPTEIIDMRDMLRDMTGSFNFEMEMEPGESTMHVLTNQRHFLGAAVLLYDGVIREFALKRESNVYIIPSSIHETILIPDDGQMEAYHLNRMVKEVNETQLDEKEILADHVYYYDYKDDILTACI